MHHHCHPRERWFGPRGDHPFSHRKRRRGGPPGGGAGYRIGKMLGDGDLKLIWFYESAHAELYDVVDDVGETRDLAAERPEDVARLRELLRAHLDACDAQLPHRKDGAGVELP